MDWIQKNFKTIIYVSFLVPILLVAFVSISHVTTWYGLSNPMTWAIYLSVGIEIAALSALAAISAQMGSKVYLPFGIVTLIQFIGNIFFAYQYIDVNSEQFKDWVDLVDPVVTYLGVESGNIVSHKRFLALFSGGMLPIISLSFLHMLVKFEEEDKKKRQTENLKPDTDKIDIEELSRIIGKEEAIIEEEKYNPTEEDLKLLEQELKRVNELKFGKLEDNNQDYEVIVEKIEDVSENEEINEINNEDNIEELILSGPSGEIIVEESISDINEEPDFYVEDEPDYSLEEETNNVDNIKRLSYFRTR